LLDGASATPVTLTYVPFGSANKLDRTSYAPFREHQSPWSSAITISPEQIAQDLAELAKISSCIRTYSIENGLTRYLNLRRNPD
jgi:hypothetical protein